jgi:hypothetical protein
MDLKLYLLFKNHRGKNLTILCRRHFKHSSGSREGTVGREVGSPGSLWKLDLN